MVKTLSNKRVLIEALLFMVFIFILSSIPDTAEKIFISPILQNLLHIPLFGVLAFLWMRNFYYNNIELKKAIIYTLVITILYSISDEYHQSFVPGRDASLADLIFDIIGCLGGTFIYRYKK